MSNFAFLVDATPEPRFNAARGPSSAREASQPRSDGWSAPGEIAGNGLGDLVSILRRRLRLVLGLALIGAALALLLARTLPDVYVARAALVLERDTRLFEAVPEMQRAELNRETVETELQVMVSRALAQTIVDRLDLMRDPAFNPYAAPRTGAPEPTWSAGILDRLTAAVASWRGGGDAAPQPPPGIDKQRERTVSTFLERIRVARSGASLAVSIVATHPDAEQAARVANATADLYIETNLDARREATARAIEFLSQRSLKLARGISETEERIAAHRMRHALDDPDRANALRARVTQLETQARLARARPAEEAASIRAQLDEARETARSQATARVELHEMERRLTAERTRYKQVLERLGNLDLQAEPLNAPARVISRAEIPERPESPQRTLIVVGGVGSALIVAFGLILILEGSDNRIRSEAQVRRMSGLRNLALVPEITGRWWRPDAAPFQQLLDEPHGAYGDAIRNVLAQCGLPRASASGEGNEEVGAWQGTAPGSARRVIAVTSCLPEEGKTVIATSLAMASALTGRRTLLLDLDLYRRGVAQAMRHEAGQGTDKEEGNLAALLDGRATVDEAVRTHARLANLHTLGFARFPSARRALEQDDVARLLDALAPLYDAIIVDTPPILVPAGTSRLVGAADATLLVLRWDRADENAFHDAMETLGPEADRVIGTVINRVDVKRHVYNRYGGLASYGSHAASYGGT